MSDTKAQAIAAYNGAFELIIDGGPEDLLEGIELAGASLHLWRQVGTDRNVAIGNWLLSRGFQKAGAIELAIKAGNIALELADTDWMVASALEALARAHQSTPEFEAYVNRAAQAVDAIKNQKEKEIIAAQFADLRQF